MDPLSRRREVAHGVLRSLPKPEQTIFFRLAREEGSRFFVVCFLHPSRRYTFDIDVESNHGQPSSCRARPVTIDDGLQNSMRIRDLGGERLPAMSHTLCPNLEKMPDFCHRSGIEIFSRLFSVHQRPNVFFLDASQVPVTYHRPSCELCDPRVGRSP